MRLRLDITLARALSLAIAVSSAILLLLQTAIGEEIENTIACSAEFRVRHWLHRDPALDPRLRIYALGDSSLNELQTESLRLADWELILKGLAAARPRAVLIDKVFSAPAGIEDAGAFVATARALPYPVIGSAFIAGAPIPNRPLLPLRDITGLFAPSSSAERELAALEWLPLSGGFPYGPREVIRGAFAAIGHILYQGNLQMTALLRTSRYQYLPASALLAARSLTVRAGRLFADGFAVPLDRRGRTLVNLAAPETYYDRAAKLSGLLRRARNGERIDLPRDAVVLILPAMYTGAGDIHWSPFGPLSGGYFYAALLNSTLTGQWIRQPVGAALWVYLCGLLAVLAFGRFPAVAGSALATAAIFVGGMVAFAYGAIELPWLAAIASLLANWAALSYYDDRIARRRLVERGESERELGELGRLTELPPADRSAPVPPVRLGRYEIVEKLGEGGMGEVYRARSFGPGGFEKEFALKRMRIEGDADENAIRRFEEEARLHGMLAHSNIAQVFEFFRMGQTYVLVMEYIDGRNLAELLRVFRQRHRALPIPVCLHIADEMLQGLQYAHDKRDPTDGRPLRLVHRDISPSNVMISREGAVKLIDFGLAKGTFQRERTLAGTVKGKLAYMSPEQARGGKIDQRSDLYSTALVLYELVTGVPAIALDTGQDFLSKVIAPAIAPVRRLRPEAPEALEQILARALEPDPERRYPGAGEIREALRGMFNGEEQAVLRALLTQTQQLLRSRHGNTGAPGRPALTFRNFPRKLKETVAARAGAIPRKLRR